MDVRLGHRAECALRLALELARRWHEGRVKTRDLAAGADTPPAYAAHVLADLVRAGLISSTAGRAGGYELSRPPGSISLLEVVQAATSPVANRCPIRNGPCDPTNPCTVHEPLSAGRESLADHLATADLAALVAAEGRGTVSE